jgi:acetyltransferase
MNLVTSDAIFAPRAVAVIGASKRAGSAGNLIFSNLAQEYQGKLFAINPKYKQIGDKPCYASVAEIAERIDVAIIAVRAERVAEIIQACGRSAVVGAVVIATGPSNIADGGRRFEEQLISVGRSSGVRILGPNCLGIMRPPIGLNAAFLNVKVKAGQIALVSQSDALAAAVLDCGQANNIGFSSVVSLGAASDIDIAETLDFLAADPVTESVMLYLEGVRNARRFMSALSAACRAKPVVVLKAGSFASGSTADLTHSGALVGSDEVFETAIRRAGAVRIETLNQFFAAAKTLSTRLKPRGDRLAIVSNGNGPGLMAADRALRDGVQLAAFSAETMAKLRNALPPAAKLTNPLDILGDGDPARFAAATSLLLDDANVDGALVILAPLRETLPSETARAIIDIAKVNRKPLLACWMGDTQVWSSRAAFVEARCPSVRTPEAGVDAFSFIALHQRNQQLLLQLPGPSAVPEPASLDSAKSLIEGALAEGRKMLSEVESKALLASFHIPVVNTMIARSPNEALALAAQIGFPVALKVHSPDISHKSAAGGVRLDLRSAQELKTAYVEMMAALAKSHPQARLDGAAVQAMINRNAGRELMIGIAHDPLFGPIITFGAGGTLVELIGGHVSALPPLNRFLVARFIARSPLARLLEMQHKAGQMLEDILLRVSEMACELPWLRSMDINPLIVGESGVLALDARIEIDHLPPNQPQYGHMAIHPWPAHLVSHWQTRDGTEITVRPLRPEDALLEKEFVHNLSDESRYFRFFGTLRELTPEMLLRFTQFDYDREMALTVVTGVADREQAIGAARYVIDREGGGCEFAIAIADQWHKRGIGRRLMAALIEAAREKKLSHMHGDVLADNGPMLAMMESLGFSITTSPADPSVKVVGISL